MSTRRWIAISLPAFLATACTSIPGIPTAGTGSKFNLATVEYVDSRESAIADRVTREITSELPAILNEAIQDERERIAAIETALVAQQSQMATLVASMAETEGNVAQLSEEVRLRVATLETSNAELRTIAGALSTEVDALPADTLRVLSAALNAHLAPPPDVAAGPAPAPAPKVEAVTEPTPSEFVDESPAPIP
ncbi:MAG: hypothetical protein JRG92_18010 [Deltaproteobacteria bacterium]|nr:hypothetical protein [Deltaproteobacteria bacterium]MBW2385530.1 hypothetical protein [Deltaproteobacteria bacterium]